MILRVIGQKFLALGAAFLNVVVAVAVLPADQSVFYLGVLSVLQLMLPTAGLGLGQRLVTEDIATGRDLRVWPWFAGGLLIGLVFMAVSAAQSPVPSSDLWAYAPLLTTSAILIVAAEKLRAAEAVQDGFWLYNLSLLGVAGLFWLERGVAVWFAVLPLTALILVYIRNRDAFRMGSTAVTPRVQDLVRAVRVASINQYYAVITLVLALSGSGAGVLILMTVYRFQIFYNWQNFFWMRFGHKGLSSGPDRGQVRRNRTYVLLNLGAAAATGLVVVLLQNTTLGQLTNGTPFGAEFQYMVLAYAVIRSLMNIIFPFELFHLYQGTLRRDLFWLLIAGISFAVMTVLAIAGTQPYTLLIIGELIWLGWRILAFKTLGTR